MAALVPSLSTHAFSFEIEYNMEELVVFHTKLTEKELDMARFETLVWLRQEKAAIAFAKTYYGHTMNGRSLNTFRDELREKLYSLPYLSLNVPNLLHMCELHPNRKNLVYELFQMLVRHFRHTCGDTCYDKGLDDEICKASLFDSSRLDIVFNAVVKPQFEESDVKQEAKLPSLSRKRARSSDDA